MNYLSLFSGIGGFEKGIENSKYNEELKCIGFSEVDKYATSIYKRHFPEHKELGDVTKIRTEDLQEFELLVGGFPCQAFSLAGKRRGFNDTRGTLFFEIARVLKDKNPNIFFSKMLKVYYLTTREELSRQYLKFSPNWGMMLNGRYLIVKTMESHTIEKGYTLKDIIEKNVEEKYLAPPHRNQYYLQRLKD